MNYKLLQVIHTNFGTQKAFAEYLGVSNPNITRAVRGKRVARDKAERIVDALDVSVDDVFTEDQLVG